MFSSLGKEFDSAIVVFVEQRFYGSSIPTTPKTLADLAPLKMDNVVQDHVTLMQKLSADHKTKNFLVFGAGYGKLFIEVLESSCK